MKNCYHIKISLDKTNPLIWREILVPDNYTFYQLHHTLQITMGWTNSHLFEFNIEGFQVGYVFDDRMEDISFCIAGELKCPPEDCGGIHGFYRLLSIMADKKHIDYKEMKRWVGAN
ncbi:MAG: plasmid pRiA4b ORF-3 family protein [Sediminibacterium sp.]|nr:plasmid pRiA4b ORF-3 family protein [Sediminibacterium sp.]